MMLGQTRPALLLTESLCVGNVLLPPHRLPRHRKLNACNTSLQEGASASPPSLQLDLGGLDCAVKETLAYKGAMQSSGGWKLHSPSMELVSGGEIGKAGSYKKRSRTLQEIRFT